MIPLAAANRMPASEFAKAFGEIAEHSAWVADRAATSRPFRARADMVAAFQNTIRAASEEELLKLVRAHPDLATKAKLSKDSANEQKGAGLDTLTSEEFKRFNELNARYKGKFAFPFIFAVKGATKHQILEAFAKRVNNSTRTEFQTAVEQVCRIVSFRIEAGVGE